MQVEEGMYPSLASTIRRAQKGGYDFTYGAPMLVLAANRRGYGNAMADCALAMENMFLQATAMGLGSCYINYEIQRNGMRPLGVFHSLVSA